MLSQRRARLHWSLSQWANHGCTCAHLCTVKQPGNAAPARLQSGPAQLTVSSANVAQRQRYKHGAPSGRRGAVKGCRRIALAKKQHHLNFNWNEICCRNSESVPESCWGAVVLAWRFTSTSQTPLEHLFDACGQLMAKAGEMTLSKKPWSRMTSTLSVFPWGFHRPSGRAQR